MTSLSCRLPVAMSAVAGLNMLRVQYACLSCRHHIKFQAVRKTAKLIQYTVLRIRFANAALQYSNKAAAMTTGACVHDKSTLQACTLAGTHTLREL